MGQILSQNEVDALLSGISDGDIETETDKAPDASDIGTYDLTSQGRVIRGKMPTLDVINQRFSREFRIALSNILRKTVDVTFISTETIKLEDFLKTLPVPTSIHIVRLESLRGNALVIFEAKLVFALIDTIFGGSGVALNKIEGKDFTSIEERVIKKIVNRFTEELDRSWKPFYQLNVKYIRSEINPQFAMIIPPSDIVVVISFEVEMEQTTGSITVCIPYSTLEPIKEKLSAGFQNEQLETDKTWLLRLREHLREVPTNMIVELGRSQIKGKELLELQVGDVIQLDKDSTDELIVMIEGVQKFKGYMGTYRGNKAIQISTTIKKGDKKDG